MAMGEIPWSRKGIDQRGFIGYKLVKRLLDSPLGCK
jgi:hypothetical protein